MEEQSQDNQEDLKKEINQIRADYNKAKELLTNVQNISNAFGELKDKTEKAGNEIIASSESIKPRKQEIDEIKNEAQNRLNEIAANLEKVKANIVSMQESYAQFSEIKGKIDGRSGEIENLLQSATGLKNDIETTKNEAQKVLENIKSSFAEIQKKVQEMQTAYEGFLQIKGKIDDEKTGLKAVFDLVQSFKIKSEALHKEIQSFRDESNKLVVDLKKNHEESIVLKNGLESNLKFTNEKKEEIEKATGLIIDTSFAETFEKRKREIAKDIPTWKRLFFGSLVLLGAAVLFIQTPWSGVHSNNIFEAFVYRIVLTSPLWSMAIFSAFQYSKERDLVERYAFKASSSAAIRSHIEFLLKNFSEQKELVANFAEQTFSIIYKQPYDDNVELMERRIKQLEDDLKESKKQKLTKDLDLSAITDSVKELKSLISDESLLKNIIRILIGK